MAADYEKSIYKQLMDVVARLDAVEDDLRIEKTEHQDDVKILNCKIDRLTSQNNLLRDDNARLKSILNNDSANTSLPPSTDQKGNRPSKTYNSREKTDRKTGGQKGHKGTTLTRKSIEGKIKSGICRHEVRDIGDTSTGKYVTKYIMDLDVNPLIIEVRIYADAKGHFSVPPEYRSDVSYGPNVKTPAVLLYSEGVMSNDRIAAFLNAASGDRLAVSNGSICQFCKILSKNAELSIAHLEDELLNQRVVATDATSMTNNGKMCYIRNFSIAATVIYSAVKKKTLDSMHKISFPENYAGILVHDYETALYHFGTEHAECNVHIIRYLRKNTEEAKNEWSGQMVTLLCEANKARKKRIENGINAFSKSIRSGYEKKYHELLASGRTQNKKTKHLYAKADETKLLNRMEKYSHNHLLFLQDLSVPFDDNMSERDLRKAKNRQKMAGGFKTESGHKMYCSILTIIETLKRRNMAMIENIKKLFNGSPAIF